MSLAVVTPVLNGENGLREMLAAVQGLANELVVVDGGSDDCSREIAECAGAKVIITAPGRGIQCAAGAAETNSEWMLFLHADTILTPSGLQALTAHMQADQEGKFACYFELGFDDDSTVAQCVARLANWRAQTFGLPYGDQGLLIHREFYKQLGGFKPLPLMEDVDLVRRIGSSRLKPLRGQVITSAARYRQRGWVRRSLRNLVCLSLYFLGISPHTIARFYD